MIADEQLEQFLSAGGYRWEPIPADQHRTLCYEWESIFRHKFAERGGSRHGAKAEHAYTQESAERFNVVPLLTQTAGPLHIRKPAPPVMAYACVGQGSLPHLSSFANLDLFVAPLDFAWTMLHTHEDHALGGPFFLRR